MRGIRGTWQKPPAQLRLNNDEVHIWRAALDSPKNFLPVFQSFLSADEKLTASKFHFKKDRHQSIISRGMLRFLLAVYLKQNPQDFVFDHNPYGKPVLAPRRNPFSIEFNVSHSGQILLFAFSREFRIGIDVERIRYSFDELEIAKNFFSTNEIDELTDLPESLRRRGFYHCWTRKEAYIKGKGKGLSIPLDSFDVSLTPGKPAKLHFSRLNPGDSDDWSLWDLSLDNGHIGAVAVEGENRKFKLWDWEYSDLNRLAE